MRIIRAAWLIAGAVTGASVARAQTTEVSTGSRLSRPMMLAVDPVKQKTLLQNQWQVAKCIVHKQPKVARKIVEASNDIAIDFSRTGILPKNMIDALSAKTCMDESPELPTDIVWIFRQDLMHSMLVAPLYMATFPTPPVREWTRVAALPMVATGDTKLLPTMQVAASFGECVVKANFAAADAFTRAQPYSPAEDQAIAALKPSIPDCLDKGARVTLKRDMLRRLIDDATWRVANGTELPASAPAAASTKTNG
jgi:hypothetical protein